MKFEGKTIKNRLSLHLKTSHGINEFKEKNFVNLLGFSFADGNIHTGKKIGRVKGLEGAYPCNLIFKEKDGKIIYCKHKSLMPMTLYRHQVCSIKHAGNRHLTMFYCDQCHIKIDGSKNFIDHCFKEHDLEGKINQ